MNYEKKYKEAINRAKAMVKVANSQEEIYNSVITIFPELKESEDKMIREYLIRYIDNTMKSSELKSKLLAWLEKQGEQKPFDYENADIQQKDFAPKETVKEAESNLTPLERKVKDILFSFHIDAADGISFDGTMAIVHNLITLCQQEQKPADKIKPKFKVGDKVIGIVSDMQYYITDVCYDHYYTESGCIIMFCSQDNFKLVEQKSAWSEEELTDFEKSLKHVMEETLECGDIHNLKADADLLLRLVKPTDDDMKEALRTEYEKGRADAFAQMQKEWSEEDEKMVANLVDYFKVDDALQYTEKQVVDWLKSLKGRAQPQPKQEWSEEDQNALEDVREAVVHYWGGDSQDILLYWLKSIKQKLKGE